MTVNVRVKPGSKKGDSIEEVEGGLVVYLRARPIEGAANEALIALLAKHFGVAKSLVQVVRGGKSREKVVEIL